MLLFFFSFKKSLVLYAFKQSKVVLGLEDQRNGVLGVLKVECYVVQLCCILLLYVLKKSSFFHVFDECVKLVVVYNQVYEFDGISECEGCSWTGYSPPSCYRDPIQKTCISSV